MPAAEDFLLRTERCVTIWWMAADPKTAKRLADALASFEESLRAVLESEARESVEEAIGRLSVTTGPFRVSGVEVDVVIRNLSLEANHEAAAAPARRKPAARKAPKRRANGQGRPPGALRTGLLEIFGDDAREIDTSDLPALLAARGVKATPANLHQQLRRLVAGGHLVRSGRGRYRRPS